MVPQITQGAGDRAEACRRRAETSVRRASHMSADQLEVRAPAACSERFGPHSRAAGGIGGPRGARRDWRGTRRSATQASTPTHHKRPPTGQVLLK